MTKENDVLIPSVRKNFVPYGYYTDLKKIFELKKFFPIYLYGVSGVGKTSFVQQACAELNYPLVRVNLTENTTEDHLFGGFRLVNGETIFYKGPVIKAMEAGAILLLDEGDQATPTLNMSLQAILEGDSYLIKQTGEKIIPKEGFNIVLAANTKGKGDDSGTYLGAQIQNEANLDRYVIMFEHDYPPEKIEREIITNEFKLNGVNVSHSFNKKLINTLIKWASMIRKSKDSILSTDNMSTRRLVHYALVYSIFKSKHRAFDLILNRFDTQTKIAWLDLYSKCDDIPKTVDTEKDYDEYEIAQAEVDAVQDKEKSEWKDKFLGIKSKDNQQTVNPW